MTNQEWLKDQTSNLAVHRPLIESLLKGEYTGSHAECDAQDYIRALNEVVGDRNLSFDELSNFLAGVLHGMDRTE